MFLKLFQSLRSSGIPVTIKEYLDMLNGLEKGICNNSSIDDFYFFSKISLVKDEKYFDRFDKVFKNFYELNKEYFVEIKNKIPKDWIENQIKKIFSDEMKKKIRNDKEWEEVLKEFEKILEEQNAFELLDSKPITLTAKSHRPAYGSDGDYFSKPSVDDIIEKTYEIMNEYDPKNYPSINYLDN